MAAATMQRLVVVVVMLGGAAVRPATLPSARSEGCSPNTPLPQEPGAVVARTLNVVDPAANPTPPHVISRKYRLLLPAGYSRDEAAAVIFDFHGYSGDSERQSGAGGSGFRQLAHEKGFVVVWPDGSDDSPSGLQGWNAVGTSAGGGSHGDTCHPDRRAWGEYECYTSCGARCAPVPPDNLTQTCLCSSCWNDVRFVTVLLEWIEGHICVNRDRVHLTGASNGAMMVYQLAHSLAGRVASIVPVVGQPLLGFLDEATPTTPVAVMDVSGIFDGVIPANVSNGFRGEAGTSLATLAVLLSLRSPHTHTRAHTHTHGHALD